MKKIKNLLMLMTVLVVAACNWGGETEEEEVINEEIQSQEVSWDTSEKVEPMEEEVETEETFVEESKEPAVAKVLENPVPADTIEVGVVKRTEEQWKDLLTEEEFYILREAGTEPAFRNAYYNNKKEGIYYCGGCGLPLYSSKTKFDSGTGWPSFYAPIDQKLVKRELDDRFGMVRTEVVCAQCDSHLGHIFPYPGVPTEERHCLNSLALDFKEVNL